MEKLNIITAEMAEKNIEILGQMFPNCLTEKKNDEGKIVKAIDFDKLRQELADSVVDGPEERYQFTWPDKRNAIRLANAPTTKTLRPCREESVDFDNTQNLYIEGDNLDVLKILRENYLGKIKMIYIDPPYNTGKDFVYNDDFTQTLSEYALGSGQLDADGNRLVLNTDSNGRFHTDWLNMIYPRLKVARDILSNDGVIFISIDDNEVENLRKICDEIYGESNFIAQIAWKRKKEISNDSKNVAIQGEYILCYGKNETTLLLEPLSEEYISKSYNDPTEEFPLGKWRPVPLTVSKGLSGGGYTYSVTTPSGVTHTRLWAWPENSYKRLLAEGKVYFGKDKSGVPQRVMYLSESKGQPVSNYWDDVATNKEGKKDILSLFGENAFDTPKPINLIHKMMQVSMMKNDIILDFFSGSSTTAHAVMKLNAKDSGNRKFIMVQLPEMTDEKSEAYKAGYKNICEIGKERIRRAGKKVKEEAGLHAQSLDVGFRVLKLDSANEKDVKRTPSDIPVEQGLFDAMLDDMVENIKEDRTPEDLLFQVLPMCNLPLSCKIETKEIDGKCVFIVEDGYLIACFDNNINETVITEIAKMKPYYFVMRDSSLATDNVADNFDQIFNAYSKDTIRRIL